MSSTLSEFTELLRNQPALHASAALPLQGCKVKLQCWLAVPNPKVVTRGPPFFPLHPPGLRNQGQASLRTETPKETEAKVKER